jgi:hypothetical protein
MQVLVLYIIDWIIFFWKKVNLYFNNSKVIIFIKRKLNLAQKYNNVYILIYKWVNLNIFN